jgi:hypothetical protein
MFMENEWDISGRLGNGRSKRRGRVGVYRAIEGRRLQRSIFMEYENWGASKVGEPPKEKKVIYVKLVNGCSYNNRSALVFLI